MATCDAHVLTHGGVRHAHADSSSCVSAGASRPAGAVRAVAMTLDAMGLFSQTDVPTVDGHFSLHLLLDRLTDDGKQVSATLLLT